MPERKPLFSALSYLIRASVGRLEYLVFVGCCLGILREGPIASHPSIPLAVCLGPVGK
jgi:hypothetical protein